MKDKRKLYLLMIGQFLVIQDIIQIATDQHENTMNEFKLDVSISK
jgi:hypothetical protein